MQEGKNGQQGAKTDPHQPMDKKLPNVKLPHPTDMQQGQNGQQGAKTDPHQPMDKKLPNVKLPHPTDMQQGQNWQQGAKMNPYQPMDNKQNDEKQHSRRNGKLPPPDDMQQGHNGLQGQKLTHTSQLMQHRTRPQQPHHHPQVMDLVSLCLNKILQIFKTFSKI